MPPLLLFMFSIAVEVLCGARAGWKSGGRQRLRHTIHDTLSKVDWYGWGCWNSAIGSRHATRNLAVGKAGGRVPLLIEFADLWLSVQHIANRPQHHKYVKRVNGQTPPKTTRSYGSWRCTAYFGEQPRFVVAGILCNARAQCLGYPLAQTKTHRRRNTISCRLQTDTFNWTNICSNCPLFSAALTCSWQSKSLRDSKYHACQQSQRSKLKRDEQSGMRP